MSHPVPVLEVLGMSKHFGGLHALDGVDIQFGGDGPMWGLVGPNGSGKTTLFNCISGLLTPETGEVRLNGELLKLGSPRDLALRGIGRTFQHPRVFSRMTVRENLLAAGRRCSNPERRADELLRLVELREIADHLAGTLSIGQQKLTELARALMPGPKIVLLDEIAAGIHPRMVDRIADYLGELAETGVRFWIVEHDVDFVRKMCSQMFVLDEGRVLAAGTPQQVLSDPKVIDAYIGR